MTRGILRAIDRGLDRATRVNYDLARVYYRYNLKRQDRRYQQTPVIVYQMGKVGSSTVVRSLHAAGLHRRIYHVHFLTPELIAEYEQRRRKYLRTKRVGDLKHIWQYTYLHEKLQDKRDESWKIVSLVRDPVARNLATFFEHIELVSESPEAWRLESAEYEFKIDVRKDDLTPLIELFFDKCRHDNPLIYFDREFKPVLGVDIYDGQFPHADGYRIHKSDRFDVLILRLEDLNDVAANAMAEFFGLREFKLVNTNLGSDKDYADVYELFKDSIRLPAEYLDRIYSSKFATHFYSPEEIAGFRSRWTR